MALNKRTKSKQLAEKALRDYGVVYGWLTEAYERPNLPNSELLIESDYYKMYLSSANHRFIVVKDGSMYYLTH